MRARSPEQFCPCIDKRKGGKLLESRVVCLCDKIYKIFLPWLRLPSVEFPETINDLKVASFETV